jgi:hypothetical protein
VAGEAASRSQQTRPVAKAALNRITIPQDVSDRIAGTASPRSSLIIPDEALSPETNKGTELSS